MNRGKLVFAQVTQHVPLTTFRRCVARYGGERKVKSFSCLEQYLCMAFAQLTYRESLRDIEASKLHFNVHPVRKGMGLNRDHGKILIKGLYV